MNLRNFEPFPSKGVYTLIIFIPKPIHITVGKLGECDFGVGYYAYTGSALGDGAASLPKRVTRHLQKQKHKMHWHIDFLLTHKHVNVTSIVAACTNKKQECEVNRSIRSVGKATVPIKNFGASDCERQCEAHLLYLGEENVLAKIIAVYTEKFNSNPSILTLSRGIINV